MIIAYKYSYLLTEEFVVDNIYGSSINNTYKLKNYYGADGQIICNLLLVCHIFIARQWRVSTLTRDIDIAILSVCMSVRPSVRDVPISDENGLTYRHRFFTIR